MDATAHTTITFAYAGRFLAEKSGYRSVFWSPRAIGVAFPAGLLATARPAARAAALALRLAGVQGRVRKLPHGSHRTSFDHLPYLDRLPYLFRRNTKVRRSPNMVLETRLAMGAYGGPYCDQFLRTFFHQWLPSSRSAVFVLVPSLTNFTTC